MANLLIVASTVRTGSSVLTHMLNDIGLGVFNEYFQIFDENTSSYADMASQIPVVNNWAGIKIQYGQWEEIQAKGSLLQQENKKAGIQFLIGKSGTEIIKGLASCYERVFYVHLYRQNLVAQAISSVKANQSGIWHHWNIQTEYRLPFSEFTMQYDEKAISDHIKVFSESNFRWREMLPQTRLTLNYENDVEHYYDRQMAVLKICQLTGYPVPDEMPPPQFIKIAGLQEKQIERRYRCEKQFYDDIRKGNGEVPEWIS